MLRRRQPEQAVQRAVFQHIRARGVAGLVALHVPMGGYRRPVEAKILQGLGAAKGCPDVLLWHAQRAYALELKSDRGKLSPAQSDMLEQLAAAGVQTSVAHGIDAALGQLQAWGLLRGHVT